MIKHRPWRCWIPAALALLTSGCMTQHVINAAHSETRTEMASLRVQHCYMDPEGRLLITGVGGYYQPDFAATPRQPVWLQINVPAAARIAEKNVAVLPQAVMRLGELDADRLERGDFREIPFVEYQHGDPEPLTFRPPPGERYVKIVYWDAYSTKNYPEILGHGPEISVQEDARLPDVRILVMDVSTQKNYGPLVTAPVAVAGDAAVLSVAAGSAAAAVWWAITDNHTSPEQSSYRTHPPYTSDGN